MSVVLEAFLQQVENSGLVSPSALADFLPPRAFPKDAEELARELVHAKCLTKFQVQEIYQGRGKLLTIGNYRLVDKLGAGGMGEVYRAEHCKMHRTVAIKVLPKRVSKDSAALARFAREARAAAKLLHPNIVAAFDADESAGRHFLVMEFVEGSDLSAHVKTHGPLPVEKAVDYVVQAARGLEFAHAQGVIHRDIKPSNLLLSGDGVVKILDMGLARIEPSGDAETQAELTGTGAIMGTVDYMAPEQALDTRRAGAPADIYSLGCTFYYLLSGRPVYEGQTVTAKLLAHQGSEIPSLRAIRNDAPDDIDLVLKKMLAKSPGDRYSSMRDVIAALESIGASGAAQHAEPPPVANTVTFNRDLTAVAPLPWYLTPGAIATSVKPSPEPDATSSSTDQPSRLRRGLPGVALLVLSVMLAAGLMHFVPVGNSVPVEINEESLRVADQDDIHSLEWHEAAWVDPAELWIDRVPPHKFIDDRLKREFADHRTNWQVNANSQLSWASQRTGGLGGLYWMSCLEVAAVIPRYRRSSNAGNDGRRHTPAMLGGVIGTDNIANAAGAVISSIRREHESHDLLVVWLMDASMGSMIDDRQKIAERIEPFFYEIERRGKGVHKLQNAVVAFGNTTVEVVRPTSYSPKITAAIRELPIDSSGLENVMTSVQQVLEEYGKMWKGRMMIVVWTDESGDDIQKLEQTIDGCHKRDVVVYVVGPNATLGLERGQYYHVDRDTKRAFWLPSKRGPESFVSERISIAYWWDPPIAPLNQDGVVAVRDAPWYGGPHREGLLAGMGPYGLTRLALETGGQFILLHHSADIRPFRFDKTKPYLANYASPSEYWNEVDLHPLRKATLAAVQATAPAKYVPPPSTEFILLRDEPLKFQNLLKKEVDKQLSRANTLGELIDKALKAFSETEMETDYLAERSQRWRAWYDLTRGRLLAMSVRISEYKIACETISKPGYLQPATKHVRFRPAKEYLSGATLESRAKEAYRLLTRCKTQNAGTPWELLADWELKNELGISIEQGVVQPTNATVPKASPSPSPAIKFPKL